MSNLKNSSPDLSGLQKKLLTVLRVIIGWHLLYEGIAKILIPEWTSAYYLENSRWIFADLFHWIAANQTALAIVDFLNIWGLTLLGLLLMLGFITRHAAIFSILLIGLYYVSNPPFIGMDYGMYAEGHYLVVNKNLIEMIALAVLAVFPAGNYLGLDGLKGKKKNDMEPPAEPETQISAEESKIGNFLSPMNRRESLKYLSFIPLFGAFVYATFRKHNWEKVNAISGATIKLSNTRPGNLKGELPTGKVGNFNVSRVILGGNMIGGWAHSRDLIYVPSLFKAYNTEKKIFETLELAEQAGINTININFKQLPLINKYKTVTGGKILTVNQVHPTKDNLYEDINMAMENGGDMIQIQGSCCDWRVRDGEIDVIAKTIDYIRSQGYPAGLGAHSIQGLTGCDEQGIEPDFYMKTLHHDNYWSAHPKKNRIPFSVDTERSSDHDMFHDNMFCMFPDETIAFMEKKNIPFMAFKILAGGAIHPVDGFKYAFEKGADFICVGMFDYQIVDDVNIALDTLAGLGPRQRPWCA